MRIFLFFVLTFLSANLFIFQSALADERPVLEWEDRGIPGVELNPLSENNFGEQIDPHLGGVNFSVVDVSLPGNFDIPVEIRRTITQGRKYHSLETAAFGDWELDIPRISFQYIGEAPSFARCSTRVRDLFEDRSIFVPGLRSFGITRMEPEDYSAGFSLHVGGGTQQLLDRRYAGGSDGDFFPSAANHVTKNDWYFTCIPANDLPENGGSEGFLGHAPDGKIYHFDQVSRKRAKSPFSDNTDSNRIMTEVSLLVSKIEDRFGNYVEYKYTPESNFSPFVFNQTQVSGSDGPDRPRLHEIRSSDGRSIGLEYQQAPSQFSTFQLPTDQSTNLSLQFPPNPFSIDFNPSNYFSYERIVSAIRAGNQILADITLRNLRQRCVEQEDQFTLHGFGIRSLSFGCDQVPDNFVPATAGAFPTNTPTNTPTSYDRTRLISAITTNNRRWSYSYEDLVFNFKIWEREIREQNFELATLRRVTEPDGRTWVYELDNMVAIGSPSRHCPRRAQVFDLEVTNPSGAKLSLKLQERNHRMSRRERYGTYNGCHSLLDQFTPPNFDRDDVAYVSKMSVVERTVDVDDQKSIWSYVYEQDQSDSDLSHENQVNTTTVTGPANRIIYEHYWAELSSNNDNGEGKLAEMRTFDLASNQILETRSYEWKREKPVGFSFIDRLFGSRSPHATRANLIKSEIIRHAGFGQDIFTTTYAYNTSHGSSNYSFGLPIRVTQSSNLAGVAARITEIEYEHKTSFNQWIIGLTKRMVQNDREMSSYAYNNFGQRTSQTRYGEDYATFGYHTTGDFNGSLEWMKDAEGRETKITSWKRGQPVSVIQANGSPAEIQWSQTIENNGWVRGRLDPNGNSTSYRHDNMGRVTEISPPAQFADTDIRYSLRSVGSSPPFQTRTRGQSVSTVRYDTMLRPQLRSTKDNSTGWSSYVNTTYDDAGREKFTSLPSISETETKGIEYTYDGLDRVTQTRETFPPYATTTTKYLAGNKVAVTDALGHVTTTTRSGYGSPGDGNVTSIQQPEGINTAMTYDIFGNITSARQYGFSGGYNVSQTQRYVYNDQFRVCREDTPETGSTVYEYDLVGNVISIFKGQSYTNSCSVSSSENKIAQNYDDLNRLTRVEYFHRISLNRLRSDEINYRYDDNGNLRFVSTDASGGEFTNAYSYDAMNNLLSEGIDTETITGTQQSSYFNDDGVEEFDEEDEYLYYNVRYTYDSNGYLTSMKTPLNRNIYYTNNGLGQVTSVSAQSPGFGTEVTASASNMQYHSNGRLREMKYGNGVDYTLALNDRLLPASLNVSTPSGNTGASSSTTTSWVSKTSVPNSWCDTYAPFWSKYSFFGFYCEPKAAGKPLGLYFTYGYDSLGRLTSQLDGADRTLSSSYSYDAVGRLNSASGPWGAYGYKYDALGNMREKSLGAGNFGNDRFQMEYSNNNRLTSHSLIDISGSRHSETNYTYNVFGGVTSNGNFTIDYKGSYPLPVRMDGPAVNARYSYDGNNRRAHQEIDGESIFTFYSQSGAILLRAKIDPAARRDINLSINDPLEYTEYIRAGGKTIARVQQKEGGNTEEVSYMHQDHLGSPVAATDEFGYELWRETYTPFGGKWGKERQSDNVGFTGHIFDADTRLIYMQARYYDPVIGRFLSVDPVTFLDTGDPRYFNRYSYAANDPINLTDPTGENFIGDVFNAVFPPPHDRANLTGTQLNISRGEQGQFNVTESAVQNLSAETTEGIAVAGTALAASLGSVSPGSSNLGLTGQTARQASAATSTAPKVGDKVFRVFGGESGAGGRSFTRTNPNSVNNFRNSAGLPDGNTGQFVMEGRLTNITGVQQRSALPLNGNAGGIDELVVPNPATQVRVDRVSGSNPNF